MKFFFIALAASSAAAQIIVGTNSFDVIFESTNLTSTAQSRIISDMTLCRQLWTNSEIHLTDQNTEPYIYDGDVIFTPYYNDSLEFPDTLVTNPLGTISLKVDTTISDAYLNAFEFADANSNIISAAWAFANTLSNTNIVCNTMAELSDYVLISPDAEIELPEWFASFTELEHSPPSVMAFGYKIKELEAVPGVSSNLFMRLQYRSTNNIDQHSCIWHDGKWKLYAWDY